MPDASWPATIIAAGHVENTMSRPRLSGVQLRIARPLAGPEHRRGRRPVSQRFLQRESGRAEGTFGRDSADDPVGPAATGAVIDFAVVIDRVISARVGIEEIAA